MRGAHGDSRRLGDPAMIQGLVVALVVAAVLGSGVVAGFFFAFSVCVMLARLAPAEGIHAMQAINVVVLNPWFFTAFFGTAAV